jgi:hypothetical protein
VLRSGLCRNTASAVRLSLSGRRLTPTRSAPARARSRPIWRAQSIGQAGTGDDRAGDQGRTRRHQRGLTRALEAGSVSYRASVQVKRPKEEAANPRNQSEI